MLDFSAVTFRGLERIFIIWGAIISVYLGYKLFLAGFDRGLGKAEAETRFYKFIFSGVGPGLFFMAFGAVVLVTALFTGGAEILNSSDSDSQRLSLTRSNPSKMKSVTQIESPWKIYEDRLFLLLNDGYGNVDSSKLKQVLKGTNRDEEWAEEWAGVELTAFIKWLRKHRGVRAKIYLNLLTIKKKPINE